MASRIVFNEARHIYALDGHYIPGVTTIINKASSNAGLIKWAGKEAALWAAINRGLYDELGGDEWIARAATASDRARDKGGLHGTQVHALAEALVYGEPLPPEMPDGQPWPEDVFRSAEQLARFFDAWDVNPVIHEAIVYSETHRWAGKLDLIGDAAGQRWLFDYKTSPSGVWGDASIQLTAYRNATHIVIDGDDEPMIPTDRAGVVWVRPDFWQLVPVVSDDYAYLTFGFMMRVAEWASMPLKSKVGAPLPEPQPAT